MSPTRICHQIWVNRDGSSPDRNFATRKPNITVSKFLRSVTKNWRASSLSNVAQCADYYLEIDIDMLLYLKVNKYSYNSNAL